MCEPAAYRWSLKADRLSPPGFGCSSKACDETVGKRHVRVEDADHFLLFDHSLPHTRALSAIKKIEAGCRADVNLDRTIDKLADSLR